MQKLLCCIVIAAISISTANGAGAEDPKVVNERIKARWAESLKKANAVVGKVCEPLDGGYELCLEQNSRATSGALAPSQAASYAPGAGSQK